MKPLPEDIDKKGFIKKVERYHRRSDKFMRYVLFIFAFAMSNLNAIFIYVNVVKADWVSLAFTILFYMFFNTIIFRMFKAMVSHLPPTKTII